MIFYMVSILLVVSIALNIYFVTGRGINIDKHEEIHKHQEHFQSQLIINLHQSHGAAKWKSINWKNAGFKTLAEYLDTLPPEQSYFSKPTGFYEEVEIPVMEQNK